MRLRFLHVFLHHLFLGLTAVLMMMETIVLSNDNIHDPLQFLFVFLSTIVVYQIALSGIAVPVVPNWISKNKTWRILMVILFCILMWIALITFNVIEVIFLLSIFLSCLAYFTTVGNWKGLRSLPVLKSVVLALVWSLVTVVFPLMSTWNTGAHLPLLLQRFLFMLSICIIYNLRDVEMDQAQGITTIASLAGERKTKLISIIILIAFAMSVIFSVLPHSLKVSMLVSAMGTLIVICSAKKNGNVFYYRYVIDGCMALQAIIVLQSV